MAITNTTSEAKHGNRKTRAKQSPAASRHAADAGRNGRRDSSRSPSPRAAAGSAPDRGAAPRRRQHATPIVDLTIDIPDDDQRLIEVVADLLLDLVRNKREAQT
jgi:hypothetical protein